MGEPSDSRAREALHPTALAAMRCGGPGFPDPMMLLRLGGVGLVALLAAHGALHIHSRDLRNSHDLRAPGDELTTATISRPSPRHFAAPAKPAPGLARESAAESGPASAPESPPESAPAIDALAPLLASQALDGVPVAWRRFAPARAFRLAGRRFERPAGAVLPTAVLAGQPAPPRRLTLSDPVALDGRTLRAGGAIVTLAEVEAPSDTEMCQLPSGRAAPCATRAQTKLELLVRGKSVVCAVQEAGASAFTGQCRAGKYDLAQWLAQEGWLRPKGPAPLPRR